MREAAALRPVVARRVFTAAAGLCVALALALGVADRAAPGVPPVRAGAAADALVPAGDEPAAATVAGGRHSAPKERELVAVVSEGDAGEDLAATVVAAARTEKQWYAQYLAIGRSDPGALAVLASAVLESGADCHRAALLRALRDVGSAATAAAYVRAATRREATDAIVTFVVRDAGARGRREPWARDVLRELAFGAARPAAAQQRNAAAAHYAAAATAAELAVLQAVVLRAADPDLTESVLAALPENSATTAADSVLCVLLASLGRAYGPGVAVKKTGTGGGAPEAPDDR